MTLTCILATSLPHSWQLCFSPWVLFMCLSRENLDEKFSSQRQQSWWWTILRLWALARCLLRSKHSFPHSWHFSFDKIPDKKNFKRVVAIIKALYDKICYFFLKNLCLISTPCEWLSCVGWCWQKVFRINHKYHAAWGELSWHVLLDDISWWSSHHNVRNCNFWCTFYIKSRTWRISCNSLQSTTSIFEVQWPTILV